MTPLRAAAANLLRAAARDPVLAVHAGLVDYGVAWDWQRALVAARADDRVDDVLLTLEHPRVFTAGRRADPTHLLWDATERLRRGVDFHEVDRGGDVTYHGPGQLVGYPIVRLHGLSGVVDYVRALEQVLVRTAAVFGVTARPVAGLTGVWVGDDKLAAIGVRVSSHGVTSHGFALNVTTDLDDFGGIVPCGIPDRGVCSLASLGVRVTVDDVRPVLWREFGEVVGGTVTPVELEDLPLPAVVT